MFNEEPQNLTTTAKTIKETLENLRKTAGHPENPGRAAQ